LSGFGATERRESRAEMEEEAPRQQKIMKIIIEKKCLAGTRKKKKKMMIQVPNPIFDPGPQSKLTPRFVF
jgi:hypothetical protein